MVTMNGNWWTFVESPESVTINTGDGLWLWLAHHSLTVQGLSDFVMWMDR
jgi:hypothetical protein